MPTLALENRDGSQEESQVETVRSCPYGVTLAGLFFLTPGFSALINYGGTFIGYALFKLWGVDLEPTSARTNPLTTTPFATNTPNASLYFANQTTSIAPSDIVTHPTCSITNTAFGSSYDFATSVALATLIAMSVYGAGATFSAWFFAKNSDHIKKNAKALAISGAATNLFVGPIGGGLFAFFKECASLVTAGEVMGTAFSGLVILSFFAVLIYGAHQVGIRCTQSNTSSKPNEKYEVPDNATVIDMRQIPSSPTTSQADTTRRNSSLQSPSMHAHNSNDFIQAETLAERRGLPSPTLSISTRRTSSVTPTHASQLGSGEFSSQDVSDITASNNPIGLFIRPSPQSAFADTATMARSQRGPGHERKRTQEFITAHYVDAQHPHAVRSPSSPR